MKTSNNVSKKNKLIITLLSETNSYTCIVYPNFKHFQYTVATIFCKTKIQQNLPAHSAKPREAYHLWVPLI